MSRRKCETASTTGFPIHISAAASSLLSESNDQIQKLIVPTEFTVKWGAAMNGPITVTQTGSRTVNGIEIPAVCQISGFGDLASSTTLNYENATYSCTGLLSIVANQHKALNINMKVTAQYEVILPFQITNKKSHPSSPDIILLTRPIVITTAGDPAASNTPQFWSKLDNIMSSSPTANTITTLDLSTMFGYNSTTLMPMVSYQTCLPVKLTALPLAPFYGSLTMRVNVGFNPIYVAGTTNGLGKCSAVTNYTLVTPAGGPANIFGNADLGLYSAYYFQFKNGSSTEDGFPASLVANNFAPMKSSSPLASLTDIIQRIEIAVPESLLGKSLADVTSAATLPVTKRTNTKFKCYPVNPRTDIVNGQIMIDPTTGESLQTTLQEQSKAASGGITISAPPSGILPGDIEQGLVITLIVLLSLGLCGYLGYIISLLVTDEGSSTSMTTAGGHLIFLIVIIITIIIVSRSFLKK